jgi:hypothetical protein
MATTPVKTANCMVCGTHSVLMLDTQAVREWRAGLHVQHAFPAMPAADREMLISGTHPACWTALFGDGEDHDQAHTG